MKIANQEMLLKLAEKQQKKQQEDMVISDSEFETLYNLGSEEIDEVRRAFFNFSSAFKKSVLKELIPGVHDIEIFFEGMRSILVFLPEILKGDYDIILSQDLGEEINEDYLDEVRIEIYKVLKNKYMGG